MAAITSAGRASGLEPLELAVDSSAAAALYERHSRRVFGYCLSRLGRREDAEDAVQTTFLHAVRGLRRGVVPATEVAWLLGIARNVCLSRWESVGRRGRVESPCDPAELDQRRAASPGVREELIGLEEALAKLPEQQRRAVLLRDWRGLSYEEVAEQLGVSHASVETLIFRGRRTLADLLRDEPRATRRRLRSLGNLGSIFTAVKTGITGGAVAAKIAIAVIAGVALAGTGAAVATSLQGGTPSPPAPVRATPLRTGPPLAAVAPGRRLPAVHAVAPGSRPVQPTAAPTRPIASNIPAAVTLVAEHTAGTPEREPAPHPQTSQHAAPLVAVPAAVDVRPTVTDTVEKTVEALLPSLPVDVPSLPVTPAPVELVPPVTVSLPPVEVVPPKLIP